MVVEVKSGQDRIVFIFSNVVVKVPKIKQEYSLRYCHFNNLKSYFVHKKENVKFSISMLFHKIKINWNEFLIYQKQKQKNNIFVPTYFSFFGLFNIQKKVSVFGEGVVRMGVSGIPSNVAHDVVYFRNYGRDDSGDILILDYGEKKVYDFILNNQDIFKNIKEYIEKNK